jgi:aconitate hydratase
VLLLFFVLFCRLTDDVVFFFSFLFEHRSSRDWASKGTLLLGVRAVIAVSFERIHRSNLVCMGVLPLQFQKGESADTFGFTGKEQFSIDTTEISQPQQVIEVKVQGHPTVTSFNAIVRLNTVLELTYFKHGGILNFVLRNLAQGK